MLASFLKGHVNRLALPAVAACFLVIAPMAQAQEALRPYGPASVADLAEGLLDAVVNISTSQNVASGRPNVPPPQVPEGSPFQDFFDDFFNDRGGSTPGPRRVNSLGSGFVVDAEEGIIITNNHVIADADEIEVNFADGVTLKAELVGRDAEIDLAVLKVDPAAHKLTAVPFGDSDAIRIGDWVAIEGGPTGVVDDIGWRATRIRSFDNNVVIIPIILLMVLLILMALLRAVTAPLILLGTVVLSFGAAMGIATLLFEFVLGFEGADPGFPLFAFVFLVALGIDYNIFLMTRVREETLQRGTRPAPDERSRSTTRRSCGRCSPPPRIPPKRTPRASSAASRPRSSSSRARCSTARSSRPATTTPSPCP